LENFSVVSLSEYGVDRNGNQGLPMMRSDRISGIFFAGGINDVIHAATIKQIAALEKFEVNSLPDIKSKIVIAAEDLEAKTQTIEITSPIVAERLADPVKRAEWVFV
jgi:hypothetical protein